MPARLCASSERDGMHASFKAREQQFFDSFKKAQTAHAHAQLSFVERKHLDDLFGGLLLEAAKQLRADVLRHIKSEEEAELVLSKAVDKMLLIYMAGLKDDVEARIGESAPAFALDPRVGVKHAMRVLIGWPLVKSPGIISNHIKSNSYRKSRHTDSFDEHVESTGGDAFAHDPDLSTSAALTMGLEKLRQRYADDDQQADPRELFVYLARLGVGLNGALISKAHLQTLIEGILPNSAPLRRCRRDGFRYRGGEVSTDDLAILLDISQRHVGRLQHRASEVVKATFEDA